MVFLFGIMEALKKYGNAHKHWPTKKGYVKQLKLIVQACGIPCMDKI